MAYEATHSASEAETEGARELLRAASALLGGAAREAPAANLAELPLGLEARVGEPDELNPTVLRLLEMGLTADTAITLLQRAPGGDPVVVCARGTRFCARRADLARFSVLAGRR